LLNAEAVEYLIVGAWALAFHGRPRYTGDVDIFLRRDEPNADRMMRVIEAFGFGRTGINREDFLRADYVIQLGVEPNRIDLLTGISGVEFDEAWRCRNEGMLGTLPVHFLSRDVLIRNKQAVGRLKDKSDIELLEQTRPEAEREHQGGGAHQGTGIFAPRRRMGQAPADIPPLR
jgi:hypothetical protein